ncbi:hypothetical protein [Humibacillus xanthopallidus]|uniref:hypothetical protein n=1 Tax=Humibacillus xanthopallidus TaxID=412689 RepID=UPI00384EB55B
MNTTPRPRATWARGLPPSGSEHGRTQWTLSWPRLRSAAIAVMALGALAVPTSADAVVRLPDPPPVRVPLTDVCVAILTVAERYTEVPLTQKRHLHNDMVLVVNTTSSSD